MTDSKRGTCRFFVSYSGVKLPLNLLNELDEANLKNRNTFFRGYYDEEGRLALCEKVVYGEIEMSHHYEYHASGTLKQAEITTMDEEEATVLRFNESGELVVA